MEFFGDEEEYSMNPTLPSNHVNRETYSLMWTLVWVGVSLHHDLLEWQDLTSALMAPSFPTCHPTKKYFDHPAYVVAWRRTLDQVGILLSGGPGPESFMLHDVQVQFLEVVVEVGASLLVVVHLLHWVQPHLLDVLPQVAVVPMLH
jgi:hypothetical protein